MKSATTTDHLHWHPVRRLSQASIIHSAPRCPREGDEWKRLGPVSRTSLVRGGHHPFPAMSSQHPKIRQNYTEEELRPQSLRTLSRGDINVIKWGRDLPCELRRCVTEEASLLPGAGFPVSSGSSSRDSSITGGARLTPMERNRNDSRDQHVSYYPLCRGAKC